MDINNLRVQNYQEAIKSSQKSLYSGLIISVFTYFFGAGELGETGNIPFLNVELTLTDHTIYLLAALYFYSGLHCCFSVTLAGKIYKDIDDLDIAKALLYFPGFINSNYFYKLMLAGILLGVWYTVFFYSKVVENIWFSVALGAIVSSPYLLSLKLGDKLEPEVE